MDEVERRAAAACVRLTYRYTERETDGWTHARTDARMEGYTYARMDERTDDGGTDTLSDSSLFTPWIRCDFFCVTLFFSLFPIRLWQATAVTDETYRYGSCPRILVMTVPPMHSPKTARRPIPRTLFFICLLLCINSWLFGLSPFVTQGNCAPHLVFQF